MVLVICDILWTIHSWFSQTSKKSTSFISAYFISEVFSEDMLTIWAERYVDFWLHVVFLYVSKALYNIQTEEHIAWLPLAAAVQR